MTTLDPPHVSTVAAELGYEFDAPPLRDNTIDAIESLVRVPAQFTDAAVTVPAVADWVAQVVRANVEYAARRGKPWVGCGIGPSLLLLGPVGSGKTFECYGAVRSLAYTGMRVQWVITSAADLYASLRPRPGVDTEAELDRYANAGLLIVDDLGASKGSEWTEEVNYRLINRRYEHQRPTLVTSNLAPKRLTAELGNRVTSRLSEMAAVVTLKNADRRRA